MPEPGWFDSDRARVMAVGSTQARLLAMIVLLLVWLLSVTATSLAPPIVTAGQDFPLVALIPDDDDPDDDGGAPLLPVEVALTLLPTCPAPLTHAPAIRVCEHGAALRRTVSGQDPRGPPQGSGDRARVERIVRAAASPCCPR